jgi:hypothetical protein
MTALHSCVSPRHILPRPGDFRPGNGSRFGENPFHSLPVPGRLRGLVMDFARLYPLSMNLKPQCIACQVISFVICRPHLFIDHPATQKRTLPIIGSISIYFQQKVVFPILVKLKLIF